MKKSGAALAALVLLGCGGGPGARTGPGMIQGTVRVGTPLKGARWTHAPLPDCAHAPPVVAEDYVVATDGQVAWAFVYVSSGPGLEGHDRPRGAATLDQIGCRYEPHVMGMRAGQKLQVRNRDKVRHNPYFFTMRKEVGFYTGGPPDRDIERTFDRPEVMVGVICDIHPWEKAWVGVLDHPFFAVTDGAGRYTISGLPPGKYRLEVWHEKYRSESALVEVSAGEVSTADLVLKTPK